MNETKRKDGRNKRKEKTKKCINEKKNDYDKSVIGISQKEICEKMQPDNVGSVFSLTIGSCRSSVGLQHRGNL